MIEAPMEPVSDEILVAYLDRALPEAEMAMVEKAIRADSALAARLDRLRLDGEALRAAFAGLVSAAPPDTIEKARALVEEARHGDGIQPVLASRRVVAASLLGLLASGSLAYFWGRHSRPDMTNWREAVAQYHRLYSERTLAGIGDGDANFARDLLRVSEEIGLKIRPEWLSLPELSARRVQALRFHGVPVAQIAFSSTSGPPLAFCIRPIDTPASPLEAETRAELPIGHWVQGGFAFMVVGDLGQAFVMKTSAAIIERMRA